MEDANTAVVKSPDALKAKLMGLPPLTEEAQNYLATLTPASKTFIEEVKKISAPGETKNILNNFRSNTYNVTLAALTPDDLKNPSRYRDSRLKYIIASSKGKGLNAISSEVEAIVTDVYEKVTVNERAGRKLTSTTQTINTGEKNFDMSGADVVNEFNKVSPGRFEMFIDGVEIDAIVSPNEKTGTSLATGISFEIFEPLSVNGFIEALHVSARAAGWTGYLNACFLLKLEFLGYPDESKEPIAEAQVIDATRYFPLKMTAVEMEVSENGTRYRCKAIPYNEFGYSNPNVIYTDISFYGETIKDILESFFDGLNSSVVERSIKEKTRETAKVVDTYEIYFPAMPQPGSGLDISKDATENKISQARINDNLRSNTVYKFPPIEDAPGTTKLGSARLFNNTASAGSGRGSAKDPRRTDYEDLNKRYDPTKGQIQFAKGSNIHEIIEAVIRDSLYWEDILANVEDAKKGDGMIDYFQIMINTIPTEMDTTFNQQRFTYQYIIAPYKVHYSRLPGQQYSTFDPKKMQTYVKRTYNYLYTGQNIDVLGFKLNFNNLFYQAANPKMGNTDVSGTANAGAASDDPEIKAPPDGGQDAAKDPNDRPQTFDDDDASSITGRGNPIQTNPYYQIAYNAHKSILESVNLLTGELDILGDPFFLTTGGMGNYIPSLKDPAITITGEANLNNGPVIVRLNFRNPVDIDPDTGLVMFSKTNVSFSGLYQVLKCHSTFKDGTFKQQLKLMRYNGQLTDNSNLEESKALSYDQSSKPGEQQIKDTAAPDVARAGIKPNDIDLTKMINRGLPTSGLPGDGANLAGILKKVSGAAGPGMSLLNQVGGKLGVSVGDSLTGINPLAKGIPISTDGLASLGLALPASALTMLRVGDTANSMLPGPSGDILNSTVGSSVGGSVGKLMDATQNLNLESSPNMKNLMTAGSGILDNPRQSALSFKSSAEALGAEIKDKIGDVNSYGLPKDTSTPGASLTAEQRAAVIADAKSKKIPVDQALRNADLFGVNLPGYTASPAAIYAKLGIDPQQLSGLKKDLDSNVAPQMKAIAEEVPQNVNLKAIKEQGIIMGGLAVDTLKNLPAVPPKLKAPYAETPARSLSSELTPAQRSAVIADANSKGIPVDQALRNASLFGINVQGLSPAAQKLANGDPYAGLSPEQIKALGKADPTDPYIRARLGIAPLPGTAPLPGSGNLASLSALGLGDTDALTSKFSSMQGQLNNLVPRSASANDVAAGLQNPLGGIGYKSAAGISGAASIEGSLSSLQNAFGNPGSNVTQLENLGKSVTSKFGSVANSIGTPLDKLMNQSLQKLGDPNAPPYKGSDPIVRRRLGLPPIEQA
jgi:hypothetical protein